MGNYGAGPALQQFVVAASTGDTNRMKTIMDKESIDVNSCLPDGDFPLLMAASAGQLRSCQFLLRHKAEINKQADGGYAPLHVAAIQNNPSILEFLLSSRADIDQATHDGHTPLMIASMHGDIKSVRCLLEANAKVTRQDSNGNEVLMLLAVKAETGLVDSKLVTLLAMCGCDPTVTNDDGFCAAEAFTGQNLEALKQGLKLRVRQREDVLDTTMESLLGETVDENVLDAILAYDQTWPTPIGRRGSEEERMLRLLKNTPAPDKEQQQQQRHPEDVSLSLLPGEVELDELPQKPNMHAPLLQDLDEM